MKSLMLALGLALSAIFVAAPAYSAPMEVVKKFEVKEKASEISILKAMIAKLEKRLAILETKLAAKKAKKSALKMAKKKAKEKAKMKKFKMKGSKPTVAAPEIDAGHAGLALALLGAMFAFMRERKRFIA